MKKAIALFGVLGLVGCFLPLIGGAFSLFDLRHFEALPVYLVLAAFAAPMCAALAEKTSVAAIVGTIGFGYVLVKFGFDTVDLLVEGGIGAKMIAVAAVGGLISSLVGFADRKQA